MEEELDFDIENVKKQEIELMNCQIDLILRSLEFYAYTYSFIYPRSNKSKTLEENLRISLVRDTYFQICSQYKNKKANYNFEKFNMSRVDDLIEKNKFKNIA